MRQEYHGECAMKMPEATAPIPSVVQDLLLQLKIHADQLETLRVKLHPVCCPSDGSIEKGASPQAARNLASPMHDALEDAVNDMRAMIRRTSDLHESIEL